MNKNKWIALLVIGSLTPSLLLAENGRTALGILTRSFGARAASLGEALAAETGTLDAIAFNPAGMAKLEYSQASATFQRGLVDDNFGYLNFGYSLSFGSFFAAASYLDAGTIDLNLTNGTQETRHAQQDAMGLVGLGIGKNSPFSMGLSVKVFQSELAEVESANGVAGDAGLSWDTPLKFLTLGAAVQNIGSDVTYAQSGDPLPTVARYGARFLWDLQKSPTWNEFLRNRYEFTFDAVKPKEGGASGNFGLEIRKDFGPEHLPIQTAIRGGYVGATQSPTVGLGFKAGLIALDYGINFVDAIDLAHRVTITMFFGQFIAKNPDDTGMKLSF